MKIFIDMVDQREASPKRGDVAVSMSRANLPLTYYRILNVHLVKRRKLTSVRRYVLLVEHVEEPGSARLIRFWWYPRTKKRQTFEQHMEHGLERTQRVSASTGRSCAANDR